MTPPPGPVAEVAPRRAGAGRRGRDEQPVSEPAAVVVPNGLLQLMTEDDAPAKALLWDWRSSMPPPPAPTPPPTPQVAEPGPAGVPAATGPLPPGADEKVRPESAGEERSGGAEVDMPTGRQREPEEAATPDAQTPVEVPEAPSPEARAPAAGTGAGGEVDLAGPGGLETWGDRVRTATARRLRAPAAPDPTPTVGAIGARTTTMARRETARRARALSSVKGALPMAPDLLPPPQVVELPRKDVEAMVTAALGGTLPAQTLPELQSYPYTPATGKPHAFKPELAPIRLPEGTSAVLTPPEVPKPRKRIRGQVKEPAAGLAPVAAATSFTLGTTPAPKPGVAPPAPRVAAIDVAGVLARLYLGVDTDAQAILVEARTSLYRGALQQRLGDFGKGDLQPDLQNRMRMAIDSIAAQAGVAAEVVHGATRDATGTVLLGKDLAKGKVGDAEAASKAKAAEEARKSAAADAAAAAGAQAALDATLLSTRGGASPAAIRAQRDRLMARVRRRLAPEDLRYEREGEERQRALELASGLYTAAYVDVARQVRERIARDTGPAPEPVVAPTPVRPPPPTPAPAPVPAPLAASAVQASPAKPPPALPPAAITASPADVWSVERMREVREAFARLRQEAAAHTAALRSAIKAAEAYATRVLDTWVDGEVVEEEGFWETRRLDADAWDRDARDRVQAWEEARSALLGADLRGDIAFVAELASGARSKAEIEAAGALGGLSDAQKAVVAAYFVGDKVTDDPLGAVAAGMRVRVAQIHRPRLVEELDRRLYALPKEKWPDVAIVAEGDGDGKISVVSRGRQFHASVDQWGTDESKLYAALTGLTKLQRHALDLWYQAEHGTTIDKELRDELEDAELDRAQALMAGDEIRADAAAIRDAIEGPGTDEQEIYRALRNKTPDQRAELERIYLEMYQVSLQEDIDSDMDGQEFQRAEALREGDQARADAIGLEMAKTGKWYGGADTDAIQDIYAQNRLEVEQRAQREGWTADRMRQENLARLGELDRAHRKEYKDGENDGAGLEASFRDTLTGPALDLALGLQQLDLAKADAARLELEKRSFITDDKVVTKILESQYDRAETEARLDAEHRLAYRADLAAVRGERWDEDRAKRERAATEAEVTVEAGRRAEGYMSSLKKTYNDKYATDLMSLQHGPGGFDALLEHGLQGSDEDRAKALVAAHGRLNPAQEIKYAVQGAGTDLDVIKRMLAGKTKEQIREIERQWNELYPDGPSLRDRIMDDVSGRDAIDLDEMLAAPETPREKLESALRRQRFEGETFALGGTFAEDERKALDDDVKRLKEAADEYDRLMATPNPDPQRIAYLKWRADQETKAVDSSVEEHRRAADSVTDKIAMVAAVVAGAIVTAVTWGAAGPFVAGALGALAAAEATIITKMAIKGAAYSEEELLVDVVSGVVDIVLAVATAGIGNAMVRVTKGVPVGRLAAMATSASRAKRMLAHGVANGVEGLISGIPSGAAGALADEKTWSRGDVLGTVLTASAMGAASGAVMGGLMGSAAGWKAAPIPLNLPPGSMPEAAARAAQWRVHQQQHPGAKYADFAADFDAGRIRAAPDAAATFQRAAQDALGSGLTRAERKALDGVSVTVLSDAEFARVTRSKKAQAVTVVENGKPRVVMRESASLAALREEGIHVAQALDPKLAGHFKLLDEAVLAHWDQLPLGTKLAVYAAKLDLEADANGRLLRGLVAEANGLPPGSTRRKALLERAAEVGDTLDTLFQRQRELRSFGPLDRVRAQLGLGRLADRLDQPARLFTKKGTKPARAQKVAATGPGAPASKPRRVSSDPATWGRQPDLTAPRRAVKGSGRSPQAGKPGVISVEQVGEPWREWSHRGTRQVGSADRYRLVAVTTDASPPAGRVKVTYVPETVVRGSRPPRWVRRGSHAAEAGSVAEQASLAMTRRHIEAMRAKGVTVVSLGSGMQNRSGQGFDEVYFEFHPNGRVEVVIVEVKDYSRRRVPLGDFTAVTGDILKGNLARLRTVVNQKRGRLPAELQSLTPSQLRNLRKHVNKATARSGLTLEVRLGATTGLGGQKARRRQDAALRRLQSRFRSRPVREGRLAAAEVDLAGRIAELGLPPASAGRLLDTHFRAVSPADVPDANAIAALAADVVARLQQPATVPGMSGRALPHVLDLSGLDASVATKVNAAVDKALAATGQAAALSKRLHRP